MQRYLALALNSKGFFSTQGYFIHQAPNVCHPKCWSKKKHSSLGGGVCRDQMQVEQRAFRPCCWLSFCSRKDWSIQESAFSGNCGLMKHDNFIQLIIHPSIHMPWDCPKMSWKALAGPSCPQASNGLSLVDCIAIYSHQFKPNMTKGRFLWLTMPPCIFNFTNLAWFYGCVDVDIQVCTIWLTVTANLKNSIKNCYTSILGTDSL